MSDASFNASVKTAAIPSLEGKKPATARGRFSVVIPWQVEMLLSDLYAALRWDVAADRLVRCVHWALRHEHGMFPEEAQHRPALVARPQLQETAELFCCTC